MFHSRARHCFPDSAARNDHSPDRVEVSGSHRRMKIRDRIENGLFVLVLSLSSFVRDRVIGNVRLVLLANSGRLSDRSARDPSAVRFVRDRPQRETCTGRVGCAVGAGVADEFHHNIRVGRIVFGVVRPGSARFIRHSPPGSSTIGGYPKRSSRSGPFMPAAETVLDRCHAQRSELDSAWETGEAISCGACCCGGFADGLSPGFCAAAAAGACAAMPSGVRTSRLRRQYSMRTKSPVVLQRASGSPEGKMRSSRSNAARHWQSPGEVRREVCVVEIRTERGGEAQGHLQQAAPQERGGRNKREST